MFHWQFWCSIYLRVAFYYFGAASGNLYFMEALRSGKWCLQSHHCGGSQPFSDIVEGDDDYEDPFAGLDENEEELEDNATVMDDC